MNALAPDRLTLGVDYEIRECAPTGDELAFVLDSWRTASRTSVELRKVPWSIHFEEMTPRILAAVARSRVKMASLVGDADTLLGWACIEGAALHYVLVRRDLRRHGIARALLEGERIDTYSSRLALDKPGVVFRGAPAGWKYNPWAFVPRKED